MSTGPQGIQGDQGAKGSRGPNGILGWGYGTTTGPTGGVGKQLVSKLSSDNISSTLTLSAANSGTLYRIADLSYSQYQYNVLNISISGLGAGDVGLFWTFNNNALYAIIAQSAGSTFQFSISPEDSITCVCNGAGSITTI
jgi:hypothetical protein